MPELSILKTGPRYYPCPRCGEQVNTSLAKCAACHATLDRPAAEIAADIESKMLAAYRDGNTIRAVSVILLPITLIGWRLAAFIPILGFLVLLLAFCLVLYAVGLAIRWFLKSRNVRFDALGAQQAPEWQAAYRHIKRWVSLGMLVCTVSLGYITVVTAIFVRNVRRGHVSLPPPALWEEGNEAFNKGDTKGAIDYFQRALAADPNDTGVQLRLAFVYLNRYLEDQVDPAELTRREEFMIKVYQNALASEPRNPEYLWDMAMVALVTDKLPEARQWSLRLVKEYPASRRGNFAVAATDLAELRKTWKAAALDADFRKPIRNTSLVARLRERYLPLIDEAFAAIRNSYAAPHDGSDNEEDEFKSYALGYQSAFLDCKAALDRADAPALSAEAESLRRQKDQYDRSDERRTAMAGADLNVTMVRLGYSVPPADLEHLHCILPSSEAGEQARRQQYKYYAEACRRQ